MKLLGTFSKRAAAVACAVIFATGPAVAADGITPMGYAPDTVNERSAGDENHASGIAIEMQIQAEIIRRFKQKAEAGDSDALFVLGQVHETGRGMPQDFVLAHKWYNLAAAHGNQAGALLRDEIASKMPPSLVLEAQKRASEWLTMQQKVQGNAIVTDLTF